jgi:nitrogen fixation protein FixH
MNTKAVNTKTSWWPRFIIATFVFFALFIGNMVRQAMQSDVDLVSKDYYKKELAYQEHINQINATQNLNREVLINNAEAAELISLVFPENAASTITGTVHFFRPSDAKQDFEIPLHLNSDKQQHIPTKALAKGLWRIKLTWSVGERDYYQQQDITL